MKIHHHKFACPDAAHHLRQRLQMLPCLPAKPSTESLFLYHGNERVGKKDVKKLRHHIKREKNATLGTESQVSNNIVNTPSD